MTEFHVIQWEGNLWFLAEGKWWHSSLTPFVTPLPIEGNHSPTSCRNTEHDLEKIMWISQQITGAPSSQKWHCLLGWLIPCGMLLGPPRDTIRRSSSSICSLAQLSLPVSAWLVTGECICPSLVLGSCCELGWPLHPLRCWRRFWHYIQTPIRLWLTLSVCPHHRLQTGCSAPRGQTFKPSQMTSGKKEARAATIWMWRQTHKPSSIFDQRVHCQCQSVLWTKGQINISQL